MGTPENGGARRDRTVDLLHAMQALSQLSYGPIEGRELSKTAVSKSNGGGFDITASAVTLASQRGP